MDELIAAAIDTYVRLIPALEADDGVTCDRIPDPTVSIVEAHDGKTFVVLRHATDYPEIPVGCFEVTEDGELLEAWPGWVDEHVTWTREAKPTLQ